MNILVIDDHPLIVQAITTVIDTLGRNVVVHALESVEAIDAAGLPGVPELILLDLTLPGVSGLPALAAVARRFPQSSIVIFSATQDAGTIARALRAGARGFIPKTSRYPVLADALQLVMDGGTYVPPDILSLAGVADAAARAGAGDAESDLVPVDRALEELSDRLLASEPGARLTDRQRQIVGLFADGLTTKEISRELGISTNTVKSHVAVIFRTLGVSNRAQVVAMTHSRPTARGLA
ncbi:MAG TPA: response regulator transcription factor [Burkholderiaceae bacterium]|nr:response regulator transcription factor [Burkholderiaceae bacterium]